MSKRLYFLISFVLVLSLGGLAQADAIEVNNPSFELGTDGNQVTGHADLGVGWVEGGGAFVGVDTFCPYATGTPEHCHNWPGSDDPCGAVYCYIQNNEGYIYQILDMNNSDANAVIEAGRKYKLTFDSLTEKISASTITASFFYGDDPDANQLASRTHTLEIQQRPMEDCTDPAPDPGPAVDYCRDWNYDLTVEFVAEADGIGETLGIRFTAPDDDNYNFVDHVRLEWFWASSAYDPDPADGAEDMPIDVNLSWGPGLWAADVNGHEVYFGTSWAEVDSATTATAGIYRGPDDVLGPDGNNRYSYDVLETLELGKTYYWRIDEVNEDWVSGPVPPVNDRWKGDVWSFRTTGLAKAAYPADGAVGIPALNLLLRWTAGTDADGHDVYFGSNQADVEDANTADTTGIYRGPPAQALSDVNYPVEDLGTGKTYFWRIDEVNTATVKGDVWSFTTGVFLIVDSFEEYRYQTHQEIRAVWKDSWTGTITKNGAEIFLEVGDANKILGGEQSMRFYYRNRTATGPDPDGSTAEADTADLEIGSDWTAGGVKALVVNFCGDPCNGQEDHASYSLANDQLWMSLLDGDSDEGIVRYPTMGHVTDGGWHEWHVSLIDPNFSGVDMNNVAKVYIGFGGVKGAAPTKHGAGYVDFVGDTVWFDDIRLYPPRCMPTVTGIDVLHALGDFTEDCNTDYFDVELIAEDWASIDGLAQTENRPAQLTDFPSEPNWITGFDGNNALEFDGVDDYVNVTDPRLKGLESMTMTAWVSQLIDNEWVSIVRSIEPTCGDDQAELGLFGGGYGGPGGLGYDWSCGTEEWKYDADLDVPIDGTWTFVAVSVDPTGATLYMQPYGGELASGRNAVAHEPLDSFAVSFQIGRFLKGALDDVRIYGYNLDDANVALLAGGGEPNPPPVYWYKLDETEGLEAADYGTPIEVYSINRSPANLVPKDPNDSEDPNLATGAVDPNNLDIVNFLDYAIMAEHWLEQHPWP